MDNPATAFDQLVDESIRQLKNRASTAGSAHAFKRRRLLLSATAKPWHLTRKPRQLGEIPPELRQAMRAAIMAASSWPLVVFGPPGTGKTCAALCLLDHAGGLYFTAAGLADRLILANKGELYNHDSRHTVIGAALWEEIANTALVVLDELGAREKVSDWHYECVKRVLDEREGSPLVVLSNLDMMQIAQLYDDRVASRLASGTVLILEGPDRRLP